MDRKSLLILAASLLLVFGVWYPLTNKIYPPVPIESIETNGLNSAGTALEHATNLSSTSNPSAPLPEPTLSPSTVVMPNPPVAEELRSLTNEVARYVFTSHGGGLKEVALKLYPETVDKRKSQRPTNEVTTLNSEAPVPCLTLLGGAAIQGDGLFKLEKTAQGIRAEKDLTNGLRIIKNFELSSNYVIRASVRLENQSTQALALPPQEWVVGTTTPLDPKDDGMMMMVMWYDGTKTETVAESWFANRTMGCSVSSRRYLYLAGNGASNVVWVAPHNRFFTLAVIPQEPAPRLTIRETPLRLSNPDILEMYPKCITNGLQSALLYPGTSLAPGQALERQFDIYAGPKEYKTLAKLGKNNNLDLIMGYSGFFGFFAKSLLLSMNWLHGMKLSYGLAIIAITVIIKMVFWPLTAISTRSAKRMSALQPEIKKLQEQYKGDQEKLNKKMWELWKKNKVNPMGGCLPVMIQIPVFFGFYRMLQSAIELRGESFLWIHDLSMPDTIWIIPGLGYPLNPLPIVMGLSSLWQMSMTPPSPGMDPVQQKMFKYMPLIFVAICYNFSAGLALYWTVQNLLSIAQMKLTRTDPAPAGAAGAPVTATASQLRPKKKMK